MWRVRNKCFSGYFVGFPFGWESRAPVEHVQNIGNSEGHQTEEKGRFPTQAAYETEENLPPVWRCRISCKI